MPRISQLTALTTPDSSDELAIVDASAATTKKITRNDLLKGSPLPADTVDTQSIADEAVTYDKLDLATFVKPKVGIIPGSTFSSTGNKIISGLPGRPVLVEFDVIPTSSDSIDITGKGKMDAAGNQYAVLGFKSSTSAGRRGFSGSAIGYMSSASVTAMAAGFVSMNADGFTLNCTIANNTFDVAYTAYFQ